MPSCRECGGGGGIITSQLSIAVKTRQRGSPPATASLTDQTEQTESLRKLRHVQTQGTNLLTRLGSFVLCCVVFHSKLDGLTSVLDSLHSLDKNQVQPDKPVSTFNTLASRGSWRLSPSAPGPHHKQRSREFRRNPSSSRTIKIDWLSNSKAHPVLESLDSTTCSQQVTEAKMDFRDSHGAPAHHTPPLQACYSVRINLRDSQLI